MAKQPQDAISRRLRRYGALLSPYDIEVLRHARSYRGGFCNKHAHIDRADALHASALEHINTTPLDASILSLPVKQNLVGDYHTGAAYLRELRRRMAANIERQIVYGTVEIDTNIDATPDLPEGGLYAIRIAAELREKFKNRVKMRIAPTPIFGFKADPTDKRPRLEVFKEAIAVCDYLSLLPEKDDYAVESKRDGRMGFKRHVRVGLELGFAAGKEVQFHLDQANLPYERGTERMLEVLEAYEQPKMPGGKPAVWVVHMISPSAYPEERFKRLVDRLLENNVGVIICPTAALSMRQIRSVDAPTHNSIARVVELIKKKVPLRLGSDNIADAFVPPSDGDMLSEIKQGANAARMATPYIWAKLATETPLNSVDIDTVGRTLYQDRQACLEANPRWEPAIG